MQQAVGTCATCDGKYVRTCVVTFSTERLELAVGDVLDPAGAHEGERNGVEIGLERLETGMTVCEGCSVSLAR